MLPAAAEVGPADAGEPGAGVVVRRASRSARVRLHGTGEIVRCAIGGRLFRPDGGRDAREGSPGTDRERIPHELPKELVVGDEVTVATETGSRPTGQGRLARIHAVRPRRNELARSTGPPERRARRVLAANLDRFVIVSAFRDPPYRVGLIDRALVIAHHAGIRPVLCFNKLDLAGPGDLDLLAGDLRQYAGLDLESFPVGALSGDGVPALSRALRAGRAVLFGHSGVGKTELLRALGARAGRRGALDRRGRGRHTTTASEIVPLPGGGEIVDTPGVRAIGTDGLTPEEIAAAYPDLARFAGACRFRGCTHRSEPDCRVRAAVRDGEAASARYDSFIRLRAEAEMSEAPGPRSPLPDRAAGGGPDPSGGGTAGERGGASE